MNKKQRAEYNKEYTRTKKGLINRIYSTQKRSSKTRDDKPPSYTKQELKDWLYSQELFHTLFNEWKVSGYLKRLKPSIDRKDDYIHYCFGNIQLMTWEENKAKGHQDRRNGVNNKKNKAVLQFDKDNLYIAEYHSIHEAERQTKIHIANISKCCSKERKYAGGYIWRYKSTL